MSGHPPDARARLPPAWKLAVRVPARPFRIRRRRTAPVIRLQQKAVSLRCMPRDLPLR